jgi:hypothetical protein
LIFLSFGRKSIAAKGFTLLTEAPSPAYAKRHGFRLGCLPAAFGGRLRDAPVVLLYLSPGFSNADLAAAKTEEGKDYYVPLRTPRQSRRLSDQE